VPALYIFPFGLLLGSFVTVVAHRVPRGEGFVTGRSRCPSCESQIAAHDNIPVVSWLALRGRCRSCSEPIPARYPLTELALGLLYVGTVLVLGTDDLDDLDELALGLVLCTVLVAITLTDLEQRVIPNSIVLAGAVIGLALAAIADPGSLPERLIAAAAAGGFLFLVAFAYPQGMGMGDVKLVAMMGVYLGSAVVPAMLVAFGAGAAVGAVLIAREGAAARKRAIPFGPYLALGGVVALWLGDPIIAWYTSTFMGG
jgi:leader peptidase (prepilin peptidase)/N-methyltransferase